MKKKSSRFFITRKKIFFIIFKWIFLLRFEWIKAKVKKHNTEKSVKQFVQKVEEKVGREKKTIEKCHRLRRRTFQDVTGQGEDHFWVNFCVFNFSYHCCCYFSMKIHESSHVHLASCFHIISFSQIRILITHQVEVMKELTLRPENHLVESSLIRRMNVRKNFRNSSSSCYLIS